MLSRSISKSIGLRPIDNPLIIHAVSNAAKNPRAIPVPSGQNGY